MLGDVMPGMPRALLDLFGRVAVDGHDFAHRETVAVAERLRERQAIGDAMIDAHADQVLFDGEGDESLRHRSRDLELFGDLVLGVAGDVIEPRCARREVEFFSGLGHWWFRFLLCCFF